VHLEQSLGPSVRPGSSGSSVSAVACARLFVIIVDEFAVLVHPYAADIHGVGLGIGGLLGDGLRFGFGSNQIRRQHSRQHHVRVRAAETEAGHSCDRVPL